MGKCGFFSPEVQLIAAPADELAALQAADGVEVAMAILDGTYKEATTNAAADE